MSCHDEALMPAPSTPASLLASESIRLAVPVCDPGIGTIITSPTGPGLIDGVMIEPQVVWPDDRGYFFEVGRIGQGLIAKFPAETTQIAATFTYPGAIKAFHYHVHQSDCWVPSAGMLQVALIDLREQSATFGVKNTLYIGNLRPWVLVVPPGVAHGYKVIGTEPAGLIYVTSRWYDPADEGRIPHDDARLKYDWELQHK
jgi:dTDP-4-dehydrorhamnose 3,5-epimerase